jgi:hypothetical protein
MQPTYEQLFEELSTLKVQHQLLLESLSIPESYYGIVSDQVACELEFWKAKAALADQIVRSLEFSVVYDWGDEFTAPKPPYCPFCAKHEHEGHKENCLFSNYFNLTKNIQND